MRGKRLFSLEHLPLLTDWKVTSNGTVSEDNLSCLVCLTQFGACVYGSVQDNTRVLSEPVTQWGFFCLFFFIWQGGRGVECWVQQVSCGNSKRQRQSRPRVRGCMASNIVSVLLCGSILDLVILMMTAVRKWWIYDWVQALCNMCCLCLRQHHVGYKVW